jgi:arsenical pump membrane protein
MSVLFGSILNFSASSSGAIFATIMGSNIGAFLTPIGALAGIMWIKILKEQSVKMTFLKFMFYGFIIAVPTLMASLLGLWLIV